MDLVPYGLKNLGVLLGSFLGDTIDNIGVLGHGAENGVDQLDDLGHVLLHETSGSDGRCADPDSGCLERRTGVERNHILVEGDLGLLQLLLGHPSGHVRELGPEVDQHQMVVGAAGNDLVASCNELLGHLLGVGHNLLLIFHIFRLHRLVECDCLGGDHVLKRSSLHSREHA